VPLKRVLVNPGTNEEPIYQDLYLPEDDDVSYRRPIGQTYTGGGQTPDISVEGFSRQNAGESDLFIGERDSQNVEHADDSGGLPPSDPFDDPDAGANQGPFINLNYNIVQLSRLLHANDERRDRHTRGRDRLLSEQVAAARDVLRETGVRLKRWIHRKTAD
jgi:hypothetical protein